jgi:hypothetical protein
LVKYRLIVEEWGGWELFQELLEVLKRIAISTARGSPKPPSGTSCKSRPVAAAIVGARDSRHLDRLLRLGSFVLDDADNEAIAFVQSRAAGPGERFTPWKGTGKGPTGGS